MLVSPCRGVHSGPRPLHPAATDSDQPSGPTTNHKGQSRINVLVSSFYRLSLADTTIIVAMALAREYFAREYFDHPITPLASPMPLASPTVP
eukprot:COSAG01_NODE_8337_length_2823_cov_3.983113_1_plen_92_part_00